MRTFRDRSRADETRTSGPVARGSLALALCLTLAACSSDDTGQQAGSADEGAADFNAKPALVAPEVNTDDDMIVPPAPAIPQLAVSPGVVEGGEGADGAAAGATAGASPGPAPVGPGGVSSVGPGSIPLTPNEMTEMDDLLGAAAMELPEPEVPPGVPETGGQPTNAFIAKATGRGSTSATDEKWAVSGTGGGVMWDNGGGQVLTAFGDTFGGARQGNQRSNQPPAVSGQGLNVPIFPSGVPFPALPYLNLNREGGHGNGFAGDTGNEGPAGQDWRTNTLARSTDRDLAEGMEFDSFVTDREGHAGEIIPGMKSNGQEITIRPTGGTAVGGRQYLAYNSVRQWGPAPGSWTSNYSGIAYSDNNGETWTKSPHVFFTNAGSDANFQSISLVRKDGYVYVFGTREGRVGGVYLARVAEGSVLDRGSYEFFNGGNWGPANQATPIVSGGVGEPSVMWYGPIQRWVMLTTDVLGNGIAIRQAGHPGGPWTEPKTIASGEDYPNTYGASIHPWSTGTDLYFTMSQWSTYNTYLMHTTVTPEPLPGPRPGFGGIPLPGGQGIPPGPLPDLPDLRVPDVLRSPAPAQNAPSGP